MLDLVVQAFALHSLNKVAVSAYVTERVPQSRYGWKVAPTRRYHDLAFEYERKLLNGEGEDELEDRMAWDDRSVDDGTMHGLSKRSASCSESESDESDSESERSEEES